MNRIFSILYSHCLLLVVISVRGSIKPIRSKEFVVFWDCRRIEAGFNGAVNDVPEDFSATRPGFEVRMLHV